MEHTNLYGEQNGDHSIMYPQGDGNGSISDASTIAKDDLVPHRKDSTEPWTDTRQKTMI
jgi:hypothetical protein